jgi:hypothetical protein
VFGHRGAQDAEADPSEIDGEPDSLTPSDRTPRFFHPIGPRDVVEDQERRLGQKRDRLLDVGEGGLPVVMAIEDTLDDVLERRQPVDYVFLEPPDHHLDHTEAEAAKVAVGISAAYQAAALTLNGRGTFTTLEGAGSLADIARDTVPISIHDVGRRVRTNRNRSEHQKGDLLATVQISPSACVTSTPARIVSGARFESGVPAPWSLRVIGVADAFISARRCSIRSNQTRSSGVDAGLEADLRT